MRTHVQKWGNSLAHRIPKPFAVEAGLEPDSPVEVSLVKGKLIVEPAAEPPLTLKQLLSKVNKRNLHREVDFGPAVGSEIW
jgi:antitoxin MazE